MEAWPTSCHSLRRGDLLACKRPYEARPSPVSSACIDFVPAPRNIKSCIFSNLQH
jgi:hypothetical protein